MTVRGNRRGAKDRRHAQQPSTHRGDGPWAKGYDHRMETRCVASTVREPDDPRWSPELPDTYVTATCALAQSHRGWHVSTDGYSWHPDDDTQYVVLPAPTT